MSVYWRFTVDCPRCGGPLTPLTGSRPNHRANLESKAVAACPHCRDTFILTLTMSSETNRRTRDADFERTMRLCPQTDRPLIPKTAAC